MTHEFALKVYYEDTDLAGIVYYANYLKFIERARSTLVHEAGIDQLALQKLGVVFAVRAVQAEYHSSARLNDELIVKTELKEYSRAKIVFEQLVFRDAGLVFSALVTVVCMSDAGKPTRLPKEMFELLERIAA